jgi:hypothetical protein
MATTRYHFQSLLKNIQPSDDRLELAKVLPGEVREWLEDHDFETVDPHTLLTGSYGRQVAVGNIHDVDVLLFVAEEERNATPNSTLIRLKQLLDDYPDTVITAGQRRSVRLEFPDHDLHLDIVPAALVDGLGKPLEVPDRTREKWIESDPLGYGRSLSEANAEYGRKLVPLIKLIKAWRDQNFKIKRPKSYVLEVIVYESMTGNHLRWEDCGWSVTLASFFGRIADRWRSLIEDGEGVPRVHDPQLGNVISRWERSHFETFMRRIEEARTASAAAVRWEADDRLEDAVEIWSGLYGDLWPNEEGVKTLARAEGARLQPGSAKVGRAGLVGGTSGVYSQPTRNYGEG